METKQCTKCSEVKAVCCFSKNKNAKDGMQHSCKECVKSYNSSYYSKNSEAGKSRARAYDKANEGAVSARRAKYREDNASKIRSNEKVRRLNTVEERSAYQSTYRKQNAGKLNALSKKRKLAKLQRTPQWADMTAVAEFYVEAKRLEELTGIQFHVDHIVPLQGEMVSGLHVPANLQLLTAHENLSKSNRFEVAA